MNYWGGETSSFNSTITRVVKNDQELLDHDNSGDISLDESPGDTGRRVPRGDSGDWIGTPHVQKTWRIGPFGTGTSLLRGLINLPNNLLPGMILQVSEGRDGCEQDDLEEFYCFFVHQGWLQRIRRSTTKCKPPLKADGWR